MLCDNAVPAAAAFGLLHSGALGACGSSASHDGRNVPTLRLTLAATFRVILSRPFSAYFPVLLRAAAATSAVVATAACATSTLNAAVAVIPRGRMRVPVVTPAAAAVV